MNIKNFQINQGVFRIVEGKPGSGKGMVLAESDPSVREINLSEAQAKPLSSSPASFKEQANGLETSFPPFFPIGDTQSIYSNLTDADHSDSVEAQKSGMAAVAAERRQAAETKEDESIRGNAPNAEETADPGSVLDLKV